MRTSIKILLSDVVKQLIYENLNKHHSDHPAGDIALIGSRRSGSTLLMEVISQCRGIKYNNHTFSKHFLNSYSIKSIPWLLDANFVALDSELRAKILEHVQRLQSGELHYQEPWKPWKAEFKFKSNRLVLKTIDAHYLAKYLMEIGLNVVLYFRHPIPQALSCMRNDWDPRLRPFASNFDFRQKVLSSDQNELLDEILSSDHQLSKFVLAWCLENIPLFDLSASGMATIHYENMVMAPDQTIANLADWCKVVPNARMRANFNTESTSVKGLSDREGIAAIQQGDKSKMIDRWMSKVDLKTMEKVDSILNHFQNVPYKATSQWPIKMTPEIGIGGETALRRISYD